MANDQNKTPTVNIPIPQREDGWRPNPRDLSTTPGGTLFAFTPGGSRIVYDREALLMLANSPLSKTPPVHLPKIPGVTVPGIQVEEEHTEVTTHKDTKSSLTREDELFPMTMDEN